MSRMPNPPRTEGLDHETSVVALQRWLFQCVAAGWDPAAPEGGRWAHDDNMAVAHLGWMIANPPGSPFIDLFCLKRDARPAEMMHQIIKAAPIDPLCAKAVIVLSAQRLQNPGVNFAYASGLPPTIV